MNHTDIPRSTTAHRARSGSGQALALALLRLYKVLLSPFFAGSCRFVPSCADYSREAIIEHGVWKGVWLTLTRLGRCHPLGSNGWDPVPPRAPRV